MTDTTRNFCNECGDYCPLGAVLHDGRWLCQGCDLALEKAEEQAMAEFQATPSYIEQNAQAFAAEPNGSDADAEDDDPFVSEEEAAAYMAAYKEHEAKMERQCGVTIVMGPRHDPYGTTCDLDKGHEGSHEGPDALGFDDKARIRWTGGGSCAGDPLPFSIKD